MASNGDIEAEDTEMTESNGEKVVTMMDVLQEQEDFEQDANAVLGASDDKNCTYAQGYIKRQAIYACMTCCSEAREDSSKRAGVCLACSLTCHENHELIELYTKRNFRCDCGNPKFNSHLCQFTPNKTDLNEENSYNQNFSGVYCSCHRPYPDPEATEEDEMIQCIMCEDWLHASHLEASVPGQYDEMICKDCMQKNEFLHDYCDLALNSESDYVDVESLNTSTEPKGMNGDIANEKHENITKETDKSSVDVKMPEESNESKGDSEISGIKSLDDKEEKIRESPPKVDTASVATNDQNASNSAIDNSNTDLLSATCDDETKGGENIDSHSENAVTTTEDNETEDKSLEEENIDSHINALKDVVESTEDTSDEKTVEEANKDSVEGDPKPVETDTKVTETEITSSKTETSNETNNEQASDETPNSVVPETSPTETIISENISDKASKDSTNTEVTTDKDSTNDMTKNEKPEEVNQTLEVPHVLEVVNDSESAVKSAEELEKMEEDKLLEDPDETNKPQNESTKEISIEHNDETSQNSGPMIQNTESLVPNSSQEHEQEQVTENMTTDSTQNEHNDSSNTEINVNNETCNPTEKVTSEDIIEKPEIKRKLSCETAESEPKKRRVDNVQCSRRKDNKRLCRGATFWPSNFRQNLCTCNECLSMYKDLSVLFLIDPEDTVCAYENLGKEKTNGKPQSQYEKGLQALSSLDRIQQINVLTEYNKMRDKFLDFLKSFKDRRKIVTEDDVKAFFAGMKPTKRPDGVYFCR